MSVPEAASMFGLPDLPGALSRFVAFENDCGPSALSPIGGHHRIAGPVLPFDELQVWFKLCIQGHDFHRRDQLLPAQTLFCAPPPPVDFLGPLADSTTLSLQLPPQILHGQTLVSTVCVNHI